ncbi:uncharacterized protein THITE_2107749 [Thermothielavioides terrestris NRRL 8126]|uniref:Uncharacterized protein n=1 Tax=Thermothielavioides terrestris (strain ATCC 38088 / NRRL 8126) TaxID=578455 RepID=G2QV40_THETT|nr:uncharacterized protein THITE_2107749 [Thermothielavioides terrestris NRRL 8126]AEO62927.1 hypothetical protein THITE_2107749 [Thermothielavioides terrestris NRRL 8126]
MAPQLSEDEIDDLLYAARTGDTDELTGLLSSLAEREKVSPAEILASARDEGKSTCLHMATGNGHVETVSFLLSHFASRPDGERQAFVDAANEYGNTGLHWAALGGHLAVVRLLVERGGASVALANDKNYVPLDLASFGDKADVVDYFLARSGGLEGENGLDGAVAGVSLEEGEEGGEEDAEGESKGKGKAGEEGSRAA